MGWILVLLVFMGGAYLMIKSYHAITWQFLGIGERKVYAEYERNKRENPNSPEATLSESEFVEQYVLNRPKTWQYFLGSLFVLFIGVPLSMALAFYMS